MIERCLVHFVPCSILSNIEWLGLIPVFAVPILMEYFWIRRWDQAWREKWERKRGRLLDTLREQTTRWLKQFRRIWWIAGTFIVGFDFVTGLDVFLPAVQGKTLSEPEIMRVCSKAESILFWLILILLGGTLVIRNLKCQLKKMDELLSRQP